jgi:hypothetical protein
LKLADELHLDSTLPILLPVLLSAISAKAFRLSYAVKLSMSFLGKTSNTRNEFRECFNDFGVQSPILNDLGCVTESFTSSSEHVMTSTCHDSNDLYEWDRQHLFAP